MCVADGLKIARTVTYNISVSTEIPVTNFCFALHTMVPYCSTVVSPYGLHC